jgi:hypothetical protein
MAGLTFGIFSTIQSGQVNSDANKGVHLLLFQFFIALEILTRKINEQTQQTNNPHQVAYS